MASRPKYLIVTGNPIEGFSFQGPFLLKKDAEEYLEDIEDSDGWLAELQPPEEER